MSDLYVGSNIEALHFPRNSVPFVLGGALVPLRSLAVNIGRWFIKIRWDGRS